MSLTSLLVYAVNKSGETKALEAKWSGHIKTFPGGCALAQLCAVHLHKLNVELGEKCVQKKAEKGVLEKMQDNNVQLKSH